MSEVSIIELIVYGLIGYPAIIFLIASTFRDTASKVSAVNAIWIIVPIIAMYMLSSAGAPIILEDESTVTTIGYNVTNGNIITNSTVTTPAKQISLFNPVWVTLHWMMFIVLILYFMWNMLLLFTQRD